MRSTGKRLPSSLGAALIPDVCSFAPEKTCQQVPVRRALNPRGAVYRVDCGG